MERASKLKRFSALASGRRHAVNDHSLPELSILGYLRCDNSGLIEAANSTLGRWLGLPSATLLVGKKLASILRDPSLLQQWRAQRSATTCHIDLQGSDARHLPVRAEVRPDPSSGGLDIWMVEDLASSMIGRVACLEASQTLTAGTVHDVNNILTVLSGNLFLLTENARDRPKLYEQARRARNAASRGSTLLRELLTFNREVDGETTSISPRNHVLALKPLLMRTVVAAGFEFEVEVPADEDTSSVIASAAQFESALINLVINARDALGPRGKVEIRVCDESLDGELAEGLGVVAGAYVSVKVIDNGSGIPEQYLRRVTEPLFSTKPEDRGSGLGLAMVKHFVENARGALRIDSVEGRGTCVNVWLPCTEKLAETTANMTLPLSTLPSGSETILLSSRDRDVRSAIQQILQTLGYTVLVADDSEAIEQVVAESPEAALLICERSPGSLQSERRWLNDLREAQPQLRHIALLQAGVAVGDAAPDADGKLYRPITVAELARTVRHVLEKNNGQT